MTNVSRRSFFKTLTAAGTGIYLGQGIAFASDSQNAIFKETPQLLKQFVESLPKSKQQFMTLRFEREALQYFVMKNPDAEKEFSYFTIINSIDIRTGKISSADYREDEFSDEGLPLSLRKSKWEMGFDNHNIQIEELIKQGKHGYLKSESRMGGAISLLNQSRHTDISRFMHVHDFGADGLFKTSYTINGMIVGDFISVRNYRERESNLDNLLGKMNSEKADKYINLTRQISENINTNLTNLLNSSG